MGNLEGLLQCYREDERSDKILNSISDSPQVIHLNGMVGALDSFVLSAIYHKSSSCQLYLAFNKEEAAYTYNTLQNLNPNKPIYFLPDSFKRPKLYDEINKSNVLQRTELINYLQSFKEKAPIIVSYPEAIFEKVVDPQKLAKQKIEIQKGESFDVDTSIEVLAGFGFERVEFVYEPGQFAIRGGIIDIFSFGNEWPYRLELFDDEVESIRTFNPTTQLSIANIAKVSLVPNMNVKFGKEEKVSLFKILPKDTLIWYKDAGSMIDVFQTCFEEVEKYAKTIKGKDDEELNRLLDDRVFMYPKEILEDCARYTAITLKKGEDVFKPNTTVLYNCSPHPAFNKNFNLLLDALEKQEKTSFENFIFTENAKQIERFYAIFEDLGRKVQWHPINVGLHEGFIDKDLKKTLFTDHQIFDRFHKYKLKRGFTKDQALSLRMIRELKPGDYVTHIDHGIGKYSGLEKIEINGHSQESVRLIYQNNDVLYVSINSLHKISKFVGKDGTAPKLNKIGGDAWKTLKRKTKKKVKDIAKELIKLYAQRKASKGFAFPPDGYMQNELEASFLFEDTPDQLAATIAVKEDMQKEHPMDRLICGDVGFGKTEIAVRAAFKAILGGKQVAILVPTTILALQHYKTFSDRLKNFDIKIDYINRFRTAKEKTQIFKDVEEGKTELLIGTHAILNKKIKFKDLGLLVIDEEQKFGVSAKERLRNLKVNVDTLTLTATPIPRTLQFSLMAARDLSIIRTPPPNRQPIHTERRVINEELIKDAIYYEVNRGGQVFFVHNRVKSLMDITGMLQRLCPDIDIKMAHGQMESKKLESTLVSFIERKFEVLVCTNIIETGLDISNANTMIINNAHHFGMADLHQLRGRVGRSNKKAFCYLLAPPLSVMTPVARKRLQILEEFSDLGSGFHIAMKDLDIRGAGNLLGGEQSGFIADIGYETYQKILEEAIMELKENEFKGIFKEETIKEKKYVRDVEVETDIEMLIPDAYVSNIQERLSLYSELDRIKNMEELVSFEQKLRDRFGKIPREVKELFNGLQLRWICKVLGFERFSLKNRKMRAYFVTNPQSAFYESQIFQNILHLISKKKLDLGLTLKQSRKYLILIKDDVRNLKEARIVLERIQEEVA